MTTTEKRHWIKSLVLNFLELSYKREQEKLWLNKEKSDLISSPTELYCNIYDDNRFGDFINISEEEFGFTKVEKLQMQELRKMMGEFQDKHTHTFRLGSGKEMEDDIINNPDWEKIREKARIILRGLKAKAKFLSGSIL